VQGRSLLHAIVQDVTDRKDAEERARRAELRKTDSLERMAGGIAHRYNNLLQVVIGNLELASHDVPAGSEPALALDVAMEAARRASDMGGMMLVYLGQTAARRAAVDLSRVCRESIAELGAGVGETARVEADLPEAGPVVQASVDQLRQVLRILLANAWEALGGGAGVVSVRVRQLPAADLPAEGCHPEGFEPEAPEYACIEVADTGVGIPSEAMDQLFDPFYTTKFAGRGLGLSVALGIVRGHAGCIAVERGVPCGSVLRVFLPLRAEAPLATAPDREGVA
jgi:signal transduction histidine kinase